MREFLKGRNLQQNTNFKLVMSTDGVDYYKNSAFVFWISSKFKAFSKFCQNGLIYYMQ